ncbi:histone deacetylase family protein [Halobacteriovorax sp. GB3]|uniref:histone deacetylase family protein n=1 Tax=Halobacteriovorax sp. GB3 TaxID=2719615 RepID=UPI0023621DA7|nr:histone deacetylase family protein [Halobacteriovorax sp. GB3]MDD0853575.1 histone deacetylase family protein [Halobacteriovorax sp. GB3]
MKNKMPVFFHTKQLEFHPKYEWALGNRIKHPETTKRAESIFREIKKNNDLFEIFQPEKIPLSSIRDCHHYHLITLYNTAASMPDDQTFYPSVFPQKNKLSPDPTNLYHAGFFCFDSGTPLNNKTISAASWSAASAFYAADTVLKEKSKYAYALSRPPGHHASKDSYGGYCYFNNAAIAAKKLKKKGRVAIIDIDFHHGNGTQELFYNDDKVLTISIHGDPREYFPYFLGFPSEIGSGKGEGFNLNIILDKETRYNKYEQTLKQTVLPLIKRFEADYLIISAGFDTYELDPIGNFKIKTSDYQKMGKLIKTLDLPTVILQEGGYYTKDLGKNTVSFLKGFF